MESCKKAFVRSFELNLMLHYSLVPKGHTSRENVNEVHNTTIGFGVL